MWPPMLDKYMYIYLQMISTTYTLYKLLLLLYTSIKLPYFIMGRFATPISLREHANEHYAECLGMNWCSKHLIIINNATQNDLFTDIYNLIEVYNNLVIELIQCFGTSSFANSDQRTRSQNTVIVQ